MVGPDSLQSCLPAETSHPVADEDEETVSRAFLPNGFRASRIQSVPRMHGERLHTGIPQISVVK